MEAPILAARRNFEKKTLGTDKIRLNIFDENKWYAHKVARKVAS